MVSNEGSNLSNQPSLPVAVDPDINDNPAPKIPITILLDVSGSMLPENPEDYEYSRLGRVEQALREIVEAITGSMDLRNSVAFRVIFFGLADEEKNHSKIYATDFYDVTNFNVDDHWWKFGDVGRAGGLSPLNEAMITAIDGYDKGLRSSFKSSGAKAYAPWFITISDGLPTDDEVQERAKRLIERSGSVGFEFLAIAIDDKSLIEVLKMFSPKADVIPIDRLNLLSLVQPLTDVFGTITRSDVSNQEVNLAQQASEAITSGDDGSTAVDGWL